MFKNIIILVSLLALTTGYVTVRNTSESSVGSTNEFQDSSDDGIITAKTESKEINQSDEDSCDNETTEDKDGENLTSEENEVRELTPNELAEKRLRKNLEEDVKEWIRNLNCYKTLMGVMKCFIVKRVCTEYYSSPNKDPAMMEDAIRYLLESLQDENKVDPEVQMLINKYKILL